MPTDVLNNIQYANDLLSISYQGKLLEIFTCN